MTFRVMAVLCLGLLSGAAAAADLVVNGAWVRALPPGSANAAVYLRIENHGPATQLVGGATEIAARVEVHSTKMHDGLMRMHKLESLEIGMHGMAELVPGAEHLMLLELRTPLTEGERFPLTLRFADGREVEVEVEVKPLDHAPGGDSGSHSHSGHG